MIVSALLFPGKLSQFHAVLDASLYQVSVELVQAYQNDIVHQQLKFCSARIASAEEDVVNGIASGHRCGRAIIK